MKRVLKFIGLPLVVAVVLFVLLLDQGSESTTLVVDETTLGTAAQSDPGVSNNGQIGPGASASDAHPPAPADARPAAIERLADGDSFDIRWIDTDESDEVRLFGINAPEANACFGDVARGLLDIETSGKELLVETIERDEFGRIISNVWVGDVLLNLRMVELGAAVALTDGSQHAAVIKDAQQTAQTSESGLWDPTFCGADEQAQLVILEIFENAPGQDNLNPNGEWIDIGNVGELAVDMTGWSIRDESTRHRFFFPDGFELAGGATVRVFSGCGRDDASELYWCDGDPVWNNAGDTAFLVDPDGGFVDTLGYEG